MGHGFEWVTIQGLDVDAVATNTEKSGETGPPLYPSGAKKKNNNNNNLTF